MDYTFTLQRTFTHLLNWDKRYQYHIIPAGHASLVTRNGYKIIKYSRIFQEFCAKDLFEFIRYCGEFAEMKLLYHTGFR